MQHDRNRSVISHIIKYCEEIDHTVETLGDDMDIFMGSTIYQNATALCVPQIGELTTHLTEEFRKKYTGMPWNQIRAMRNVVAHNYGSIDKEVLWDTIQNDIPELKSYCMDILTGRLTDAENIERATADET